MKMELHRNYKIYRGYINSQVMVDGIYLGDGRKDGKILLRGHDNQYFYNKGMTKFFIGDGTLSLHKVKTTIRKEELDVRCKKVIPQRYMKGKVQDIKAILRGLFGANGSVNKSNITMEIASIKMSEQIVYLLNRLGIYSEITERIRKRPESIIKEAKTYTIRIKGDSAHRYMVMIGFPLRYKNECYWYRKRVKDVFNTGLKYEEN